jgi:multidrug resistance efflux pump
MSPANTISEKSGSRRMLAPVAYSEAVLPSLRLARSSRLARATGKLLLAMLVLGTFLVTFLPWQQSVKGTGDVIAFAPLERQQAIQSPIKGRIVRLGDGIVENALVRKGELIAEVADIDIGYMERLEGQLVASRGQVEAANSMLEAGRRNLEAARTVVTSCQSQVVAWQLVKQQVIIAADAAIESTRNKIDAESQQLAEHHAALKQVEADYHRQKTLFEENIASELKFQEADRKYREAEAKVEKSKASIRSAENELSGKISERAASEQEAQIRIDNATANLQKAQAEVAKAESDVAKAEAGLNSAEKELLDAETRVARQRNQQILAPFDGFVTRVTPNQSSQILKEGDVICVIVPDTSDRAVQLWLDGNDAPLVEPGRMVRLQFEGWPAVQFAGWPSVAVGTFGGTVVSVDAIGDGQGKFRVLVQPDPTDQPWPAQRFLRQGVRANGWVLLEQVPLWYEVWRNMNGFPPVISGEESASFQPPNLPKP